MGVLDIKGPRLGLKNYIQKERFSFSCQDIKIRMSFLHFLQIAWQETEGFANSEGNFTEKNQL